MADNKATEKKVVKKKVKAEPAKTVDQMIMHNRKIQSMQMAFNACEASMKNCLAEVSANLVELSDRKIVADKFDEVSELVKKLLTIS